MRRTVAVFAVMALAALAADVARAVPILSLPDGTVVANRQDSGTGADWFGESITTLTIDAQNVGAQHVVVSGKITDLNPDGTVWVEIGLIPKGTWDYWQTAFGGGWKSAVFDKGIYVVNWSSGGLGLSLEENSSSTGPFAWTTPSGLAEPTVASPWEFSITMFPTGGGGGGGAYLSVVGETIYGTQPFAYSDDYSQSYLHARIWSTTRNAAFSFSDVQAAVIPEPCTVALLAGACGGLVVTSFRKRRRGPQR